MATDVELRPEPCAMCGERWPVEQETCPGCGAIRCRQCKTHNSADYKFCMSCGRALGCGSCGAKLPAQAKFCPACGTAREPTISPLQTPRNKVDSRSRPRGEYSALDDPRNKMRVSAVSKEDTDKTDPSQSAVSHTRKRLQLEIHAREHGVAGGRSIFANLLGQPSLIKCEFVAIGSGSQELYSVEFLRNAGQVLPIEMLTGIDRQEAQKALEVLHKHIIDNGWTPATKGAHWYSYRYEKNNDAG